MVPVLSLLACTGRPPVEALAGPDTAESDSAVDSAQPELPPSVLLFIGDGMGFAHVAGGGIYGHGSAGALTMETLPIQGRIRTASLTGVTDSAAAATSFASGRKTWNDWLGLDRDGVALTTILDAAEASGMSTGIVTNDTVTGATPAAFLVHTPDRGDSNDIAVQEAANLPDVLLGGGTLSLGPLLEGADLQRVSDAITLDAAILDERPLVGLFADDSLPFVLDGLGGAPTLAQMTEAALRRLGSDPEGFFLMVEGARIDHASHARRADQLYPEVVAFDEAVAAGVRWAADRDNVTLIVTADHECGGIDVAETGTAGEVPTTTFRWGAHTNADVPVYAMGVEPELFHGNRLDALWVHEVLAAAVEQRAVAPPVIVPLIDGWLDDVGEAVTVQTFDTDFGPGFDQLDALRITADADGVRVGIDGSFDRSNNTVVVLFDLDFGEGTGLGGVGEMLPDTIGELESVLSAMNLTTTVPGLGFDLAMVSIRAREIGFGELQEDAGLRGLAAPWGSLGDLWWLPAVLNYDDGNVSVNDVAGVDAGPTGGGEHGLEALLPWSSVWPEGMPTGGQTLAVFAAIVYTDGTYPSNQALPPFDGEPEGTELRVSSVVRMTVDATGQAVGTTEVVR